MLAEFYRDSEVFITGGSGVIGKAAIEKLLRSSDVKKIYMLLRCKKDDSVEQRLEKIKNAKIFRVLKTQKPDALDKLVAIPGDAVLPNLGITTHYAKLLENVTVFIHCAATVRFNEPLKVAIKLNVGGTWEALKLAETLKKLKIFLHVSTFYSNPYLDFVESKMYSSPMNWKLCLQMLEDETKEELLNTLTKKILVGFPNTYSFSKNLAESVVNDYFHRLPVVIFRPSIVVTAYSEPEPGFPPSVMGVVGLLVLIGAGVLKVLIAQKNLFLDFTPQDIVTVLMLTSAYSAAKQYEHGKIPVEIPVTLASSYKIFPYKLERFRQQLIKYNIWKGLPFDKNLLLPGYFYVSSEYLYSILFFIYHLVPALLIDGLLFLLGRKRIMMSLARKQYNSVDAMKPFMFKEYKSDMVDKLPEILDVVKGTDFDFSDWMEHMKSDERFSEYARNSLFKIREVLMNEDPSTLPRARRVQKVKIVLYNVIRGCLAYYVLRWVFRILLEYFQ